MRLLGDHATLKRIVDTYSTLSPDRRVDVQTILFTADICGHIAAAFHNCTVDPIGKPKASRCGTPTASSVTTAMSGERHQGHANGHHQPRAAWRRNAGGHAAGAGRPLRHPVQAPCVTMDGGSTRLVTRASPSTQRHPRPTRDLAICSAAQPGQRAPCRSDRCRIARRCRR